MQKFYPPAVTRRGGNVVGLGGKEEFILPTGLREAVLTSVMTKAPPSRTTDVSDMYGHMSSDTHKGPNGSAILDSFLLPNGVACWEVLDSLKPQRI